MQAAGLFEVLWLPKPACCCPACVSDGSDKKKKKKPKKKKGKKGKLEPGVMHCVVTLPA